MSHPFALDLDAGLIPSCLSVCQGHQRREGCARERERDRNRDPTVLRFHRDRNFLSSSSSSSSTNVSVFSFNIFFAIKKKKHKRRDVRSRYRKSALSKVRAKRAKILFSLFQTRFVPATKKHLDSVFYINANGRCSTYVSGINISRAATSWPRRAVAFELPQPARERTAIRIFIKIRPRVQDR